MRENPEDGALLNRLSGVRYSQGDYREAAELLERSLKIEAENPDALFGLGMCSVGMGRAGEARRYFTQARELYRKIKSLSGVEQAEGELGKLR